MPASNFDLVARGDQYRVIYQALNFASGLTDVMANIYHPDGTLYSSSLSLTEIGSTGVYYYDFSTSVLSVLYDMGVWVFIIDSATAPNKQMKAIHVFNPNDMRYTPFYFMYNKVESIQYNVASSLFGNYALYLKLNGIEIDLDNIYDDTDNIDMNVILMKADVSDIKTDTTSIESLIQFVNNLEEGDAELSGTQMIYRVKGGGTEIARFDLYDSDGNLTDNPFRVVEYRRVVP